MKITFLVRSLNYGGAERQLITLAKGLKKNGHSVLVIVFYPGGSLEKELRDAQVSIRSLDKRGRWDLFRFFFRLFRAVFLEKPDILHGYLGVPNILAVLLKPFLTRTRIVWGVRASNMQLEYYDWLIRLLYRLECWLSRFADLIISNSRAGMEYAVKNGFPINKMQVIPNGIDTDLFRPDREARQKVREEWGVRENEILIGLVGRLDPMKDHTTFLKAAAAFAKKRNNVRFVCVGDGSIDYKHKLYELSNTLGLKACLWWIGSRKNMNSVYNALDILTSTSVSEGFSNVIAEAMSCGIPCVVTDVGDSAWIVGDMGIVVEPENPKQVVNGWEKCLTLISFNNANDPLRIIERITEQFSKEHLVVSTETVLEDLL